MQTIVLHLLLCISIFASKVHTNWYTYDNGEVVIEFPKEPEFSSQQVETAIGKINMNIASYDGSSNGDANHAYVFISSVYPDSLINSSKKELLPEFFRKSIDGAVTNVNGKLLTEKEVVLDGFPGREVKVDYGNGLAVILMRMYLVKNRAYFIQTITETSKDGNEGVLRFHQSFNVKK